MSAIDIEKFIILQITRPMSIELFFEQKTWSIFSQKQLLKEVGSKDGQLSGHIGGSLSMPPGIVAWDPTLVEIHPRSPAGLWKKLQTGQAGDAYCGSWPTAMDARTRRVSYSEQATNGRLESLIKLRKANSILLWIFVKYVEIGLRFNT